MKTMALDGFTFGQTVTVLVVFSPSSAKCLVSACEEFVRDQQHLRDHHQHPGLDVKKEIRTGLIDLRRKMSHVHRTVR